MSFSSRSKRPDQSGVSSATRTSCALIRSRPSERSTEPSTTRFACSCWPTSRILRGLSLNVNDEVRDLTSNPSITDRFRMISSVRPSTKYSLFGSALRFLNGRTAMVGVSDVHQSGTEPKPAATARTAANRDVSPPSPDAGRSSWLARRRSGGTSDESAAPNASGLSYRFSGFGSSARSTTRTNALGRSGRAAASGVRVPWA